MSTNYNVKYWDIYDIELSNRQAGYHFFDADTKRFFNSRIGTTVYQGEGGIYFVTSEQFETHYPSYHKEPRKYTVRSFDPDTGEVNTAGEFNELTRYMAHKQADKLSRGESID